MSFDPKELQAVEDELFALETQNFFDLADALHRRAEELTKQEVQARCPKMSDPPTTQDLEAMRSWFGDIVDELRLWLFVQTAIIRSEKTSRPESLAEPSPETRAARAAFARRCDGLEKTAAALVLSEWIPEVIRMLGMLGASTVLPGDEEFAMAAAKIAISSEDPRYGYNHQVAR